MNNDPQIISLRPAIVHVADLVQGDTAQFTVRLAYHDGEPYDLTGHDINMDIRRQDQSLVLAYALGDGITITAPGEATIVLPSADTEPLGTDYTYQFDVQIEKDGVVRTVWFGTLKMMKQITL
jgi:hypothetical protein